jgi:Protein of unknown function (DUF3667)
MSVELPVDAAATPCRNCGAHLAGRYCAQCGQAAGVHVPSTREIVLEAIEGLTHLDSRLWRTLQALWFRPGKLTLEFIAGRRAAYLPPFRLYLVLSLIFFLVESLSADRVNFVVFDLDAGQASTHPLRCEDISLSALGRNWGPRITHACQEAQRDKGARLWGIAIHEMPKAMFFFLPVIAFLQMLMYWWPRHRYAEHLLFFLHLHAFFFSVMTAVALAADAGAALPAASRGLDTLVTLLLWTVPVYTLLALRRVFRRGWALTLVKAAALFIVYAVVISATVGGVFFYAALQL